jgi:hypothetical protein
MFKNRIKNSEPTPKAIKRRLFFKKLGRGALWSLFVFIVIHSGFNLYTSILLNRELAAIRGKGEPITLTELAPPAVPDSQNAALLYQQAKASLKLTEAENKLLNSGEYQVTPNYFRVMEAALNKNRQSIDLLKRAATLPFCRFEYDWSGDPLRITFPHFGSIRHMAKLLVTQTSIDIKRGDTVSALECVRALYGMSYHLSHEQFYIGYLVALAIENLANGSLDELLNKQAISVTEAKAFQKSLPVIDWQKSLKQVLYGERASTNSIFSRVGYKVIWEATPEKGGAVALKNSAYSALSFISRPLLKLDQVNSLRFWQQTFDSLESMPSDTKEVKRLDEAIKNAPRYAVLTRLLMPSFNTSRSLRDKAEVVSRQREIALALASYRTAKGSYPANLKQLESCWGQPLPSDLFGAKPFAYRLDKDDYLLYSVGPNLKDDKGVGREGLASNSQAVGKILENSDDILWGAKRFAGVRP